MVQIVGSCLPFMLKSKILKNAKPTIKNILILNNVSRGLENFHFFCLVLYPKYIKIYDHLIWFTSIFQTENIFP